MDLTQYRSQIDRNTYTLFSLLTFDKLSTLLYALITVSLLDHYETISNI